MGAGVAVEGCGVADPVLVAPGALGGAGVAVVAASPVLLPSVGVVVVGAGRVLVAGGGVVVAVAVVGAAEVVLGAGMIGRSAGQAISCRTYSCCSTWFWIVRTSVRCQLGVPLPVHRQANVMSSAVGCPGIGRGVPGATVVVPAPVPPVAGVAVVLGGVPVLVPPVAGVLVAGGVVPIEAPAAGGGVVPGAVWGSCPPSGRVVAVAVGAGWVVPGAVWVGCPPSGRVVAVGAGWAVAG